MASDLGPVKEKAQSKQNSRKIPHGLHIAASASSIFARRQRMEKMLQYDTNINLKEDNFGLVLRKLPKAIAAHGWKKVKELKIAVFHMLNKGIDVILGTIRRLNCQFQKFTLIFYTAFKNLTEKQTGMLVSEIARQFTQLQILTIHFPSSTHLTSQGLGGLGSEIARNSTNLNQLNLFFRDVLQEIDLGKFGSEIGRYMSRLQILKLYFYGFNKLDDKAVENFVSKLGRSHKLHDLELSFWGSAHLSNQGLKAIGLGLEKHLYNLQRLRLDFTFCKLIDNRGLKAFGLSIGKLTQLKQLNLSFGECRKITDKGLESFSSGFQVNLLQLRQLDLGFAGCYNITDQGVQILTSNIVRHLSQLQQLSYNFQGCKKVTDKTVEHLGSDLAKNPIPLKKLKVYFSGCTNMTSNGLEAFRLKVRESPAQLQQLDITFDPSVSKAYERDFLRLMEQLRYFIPSVVYNNVKY